MAARAPCGFARVDAGIGSLGLIHECTRVVFAALVALSLACRAIATLLMFDATVMFAIPTLSNPRSGTIDKAAIGFLQQNLGLERFYTLGPIQANYGAYFNIASINHNYLPVPRLWTGWVMTHLDRGADPIVFNGNFSRGANQPSAEQELRGNLAAYEEAGVKYVVTPAGQNPFLDVISTQTLAQGNRPLSLAPGRSLRGVIPASPLPTPIQIDAVSVLIGNYHNTADGTLNVSLCAAGQCVSGSIGLTGSQDNAILWVPLSQLLTLTTNSAVSYSILYRAGTKPVAIWTYPTDVSQSLIGPGGAVSGFGLKLQLRKTQSTSTPRQVYGDGLMSIYQLPAPKPYFEALGGSCMLLPQSRTSVVADCAKASVLVRRELFFPGWQARIDGQPTPIAERDGLFQSINLPAGRSAIAYHYAPLHILWAWLLMGLAVAALAVPSFVRKKAS